jgi:hypothetical protein
MVAEILTFKYLRSSFFTGRLHLNNLKGLSWSISLSLKLEEDPTNGC